MKRESDTEVSLLLSSCCSLLSTAHAHGVVCRWTVENECDDDGSLMGSFMTLFMLSKLLRIDLNEHQQHQCTNNYTVIKLLANSQQHET